MKVTPDLGFKISDHIWKPGFQWQRGGAFQREVLTAEIVNQPNVVLNCKSKPQRQPQRRKKSDTQYVSTLSSHARIIMDVYFYMYNHCPNTLHQVTSKTDEINCFSDSESVAIIAKH